MKWRRLWTLYGALAFLGLSGCGLTPEEEAELAQERVEFLVRQAEARITYDTKKPGRPVIGLDFEKTHILDAGLRNVGKLKTLRTLNLAHCGRITDLGVAQLTDLHNLETLDLSGTRTTDECVKHLLALKNLRTLNLSDNHSITSLATLTLKKMKHLQTLDLSRCYIFDKELAELREALPKAKVICEEPIRSDTDDGGPINRPKANN